ncbi:MAG: hypothetical protein AB7S26_24760 [Sandaracinaceae bacterium]
MAELPHPPASRHGELRELFDDVFFVSGTVRMNAMFTFSRNMTVVRQGRELTILNSMRLSDEGLAALEALGDVKHVIRVASFHGMDDRFYKERYGATVWATKGSSYVTGLGNDPRDAYFTPDRWVDASTELPVGRPFIFESARPPEALVVLDRDGGIVVAGDALQNWHRVDEYFNVLGGLMMRPMGFIKAHNVGPGWLRGAKPSSEDLRRVLELDFDHVLPAHGAEVIGDAKEKYRPSIERAAASTGR